MKVNFWLRFYIFLIAGSVLASAQDGGGLPQTGSAASVRRVGVEAFAKELSAEKSVVLDVRTPREFASGHLKGARNLDFYSSDFDSELAKLDKTKTYLVYCAGGARSASACKKMRNMGFMNLVDLAPGFSGWKAAKMPVEK